MIGSSKYTRKSINKKIASEWRKKLFHRDNPFLIKVTQFT